MSKVIAVNRLMKLCEKGRLTSDQNASNSGIYRDIVADAVENHSLHRQAYAVASRAYKMLARDELKGQEFIDNAILYLEMVRDNFVGHTGDFAKAAEKAEKEEQAERPERQRAKAEAAAEQRVSENVRALRGIRKLKTDKAPEAESIDAA